MSAPTLLDLTARLEAFEAYAQMLSHRFDVRVVFDGQEANTDGRVIRLPILETLTEPELDMLYGILLHEVGHVRYSDFSDTAFGKLRHAGDLYLANAIEDARVETLLMRDLAGAGEIFDRLYSVHSSDRQRMARLFGPADERPHPDRDPLYAIGRLLHARLHQLQIDATQGVAPRAAAVATTVLEQAGLLATLGPSSVTTWDEVVALAQRAFDAWAASTTAPAPPPLHLEAKQMGKQDATDALEQLRQQHAAIAASRVEREQQLAELRKTQAPLIAAATETLQQLEPKLEAAAQAAEALARVSDMEATLQATQQALRAQRAKVGEREAVANQGVAQKRAGLTAKRDLVAAQLEALEQAGRRPAQQAQLRTRLETLQQQMDALTPAAVAQGHLDRLAKLEQDATQQERDLLALRQQVGEPQRAVAQAATLDALQQQVAAASRQIGGQAQAVQQRRAEIAKLVSAEKTVLRDGLSAVRQSLEQAGLPVAELLPTAQATPGWEAVDRVQTQFDAEASAQTGDWVVGGIGLGSGTRQMAMLIDQAIQDVQQLDIGQLLQAQHGSSPLARFRDTLGRMPSSETGADRGLQQGAISRPYRVWKTTYDRVLGKSAATPESRAIHAADVEAVAPIQPELRRLVASRFAFATRDRFHGGQEEGQLDQRSLWRLAARQGDTFFEINRPVPVNRTAVSILLDLSGSLDRAETGQGALPRQIALALSDALERVHVPHEILGFHAPVEQALLQSTPPVGYQRRIHALEHWVLRDWKGRGAPGLGHAIPQCTDNADGESIRFAWQRLRRQGAQRKVLVVISDVRPWLDGADPMVMDRDVEQACEMVRAAKGDVLALSVGEDPAPLYGPRSAMIASLRDLPAQLATILPPRA